MPGAPSIRTATTETASKPEKPRTLRSDRWQISAEPNTSSIIATVTTKMRRQPTAGSAERSRTRSCKARLDGTLVRAAVPSLARRSLEVLLVELVQAMIEDPRAVCWSPTSRSKRSPIRGRLLRSGLTVERKMLDAGRPCTIFSR